jgi:hypothetical protein
MTELIKLGTSIIPRDRVILIDIGFPWPFMAVWSESRGVWVYPDIRAEMDSESCEWNDFVWENETVKESKIIQWWELPECMAVEGVEYDYTLRSN